MSKTEKNIAVSYLEDNQEYSNVMKDSIKEYSSATFKRAFPYYADGLKPIVKRILYGMYLDKVTNFRKVNFVVGNVAGDFHPYAETAIEGAIVLLGQTFTTNHPFVDTQGNFGSQAGDPAAAKRYIECKLSKFAQDVVTDEITDYSIEYGMNYDWTIKEPKYLPSKIPLLLVQGTFGIGEAFTVSIPPHNLTDVVNMCIKCIINKNISEKELTKGVMPDFPTGGIITNPEDIIEYYGMTAKEVEAATAERSFTVKYKGRTFIDRKTNSIWIQELPYGVTFDKIRDKIISEAKLKGNPVFMNVINFGQTEKENGETWFEIVCKKGSNLLEILNMIYDKTQLTSSSTLSFIINFDEKIKRCSIKDIIIEWLKVRRKTKRRKFTSEHSNNKNRVHILEGLTIVYMNRDEIIKLITSSKDKEELINNLVKKYKLSLLQARSICDMPIHQLTKLSKEKLFKEIAEKKEIIKKLEYNLEHVDEDIIKDLKFIEEKYRKPKKTTIESISNKKTKIAMSSGCLLASRNAFAIYDMNNSINGGNTLLNGLPTIKEDNKNIKEMINAHEIRDDLKGLLFFNGNGTSTYKSVKDIQVINNWILNDINDLKNPIISVVPIYNNNNGYVFIVSKDKKIKKVKSSEFESAYKSIQCGKIYGACHIEETYEGLFIITPKGESLYLPIDEIPTFNRSAKGNSTCFNEKDKFFFVPIRKNEAPILSLEDNSSGYVTMIDKQNLTFSKRINKPEKLISIKNTKVSGVGVIDITTKNDSTVLCISNNNITRVKGKSFSATMIPRRIGLKSFKTIQIGG